MLKKNNRVKFCISEFLFLIYFDNEIEGVSVKKTTKDLHLRLSKYFIFVI